MDEKVLETIRTANGKDPIAEVEAHLESIAKANTSHERFRAKYDGEKQRLFKALLPLAAGRSMTYEELEEIIEMNPRRHPGYKIVRDVCKKLLKEHRQVWKPVTRFGLVRQTDEQVIDRSHKVLKSVHKKVRRSGDRVSSVEYDKLDETRKMDCDTHMTIVTALSNGLSRKGIAAIQNKVAETQKRLENGEAYAQWFSQFRNRLPASHK